MTGFADVLAVPSFRIAAAVDNPPCLASQTASRNSKDSARIAHAIAVMGTSLLMD